MRIEMIEVQPLCGDKHETPVCINPRSLDEVLKALRMSPDSGRELRVIVDMESGDVFIWSGYGGTHDWVAAGAGLDKRKCLTMNAQYDDGQWKVDWMQGFQDKDYSEEIINKREDLVCALFGVKPDWRYDGTELVDPGIKLLPFTEKDFERAQLLVKDIKFTDKDFE